MDNSVFAVCLPFAAWISQRDAAKARIDNFPDRLHYRVTTGALFMATAILAMGVHFRVTRNMSVYILKDILFQSIDCTGRDSRGSLSSAPQVYIFLFLLSTLPQSPKST